MFTVDKCKRIVGESIIAIYNHDEQKIAELLEEVRSLCSRHKLIHASEKRDIILASNLAGIHDMLTFIYCENFGKSKCQYLEDTVGKYVLGFGYPGPNPCPNPTYCKLRQKEGK
jgi:hypothetical protein